MREHEAKEQHRPRPELQHEKEIIMGQLDAQDFMDRKNHAKAIDAELAVAAWQYDQTRFFIFKPEFSKQNNPQLFDLLNCKVKLLAHNPKHSKLSGLDILFKAAKSLSEDK
jgi:hypothetical protein